MCPFFNIVFKNWGTLYIRRRTESGQDVTYKPSSYGSAIDEKGSIAPYFFSPYFSWTSQISSSSSWHINAFPRYLTTTHSLYLPHPDSA
jgi:hypothetical protein